MPEYLISVDAGNGGTNAVMKNGKGVKAHYEPSVRAAVSGDSLGLANEVQFSWARWNGFTYATGEDVTRVTRRGVERHSGANRYGNEFHQYLTALACARLGVKSGTVKLTLFAPPGMYLEAKETMEAAFSESGGTVEIQLKEDKKPRTWTYESITVWPEGLGAAACFALDEKGKPVASDALAGDVVVLDSGAYTLDALAIQGGKFNPESLSSATWKDQGVDAHIRQPILNALRKNGGDFDVLTVDDVDKIIRRGLVSDDYELVIGASAVDLRAAIEKYSERYAEWVANNIIDGVFAGLNGYRGLIGIGGGWTLIEKYITGWYGDKILDRKKYPHTKKLHPVDMNSHGGLRLAMSDE